MRQHARARSARLRPWAALGLSAACLVTACESAPDVVATIEPLLDGGAGIADEEPVMQPPMMPPAPPAAGAQAPPPGGGFDICDPAVFGLYVRLSLTAANCEVRSDELTAPLLMMLGDIDGSNTEQTPAEVRPPDGCDLNPQLFFIDPDEPDVYKLCSEACEALRTWLRENRPSLSCINP